jgi:hypothetical protein
MIKACTMAGALLLAVAPALEGQVVHGRVVDDATAAPLDFVTIDLLDGTGERRGGTVSDSAGEFSVRAPGAGSWTLRLTRIGYAAVHTAAVEVGASERVELELRMSLTAVPLEALRVVARAEYLPGRLREFRERAEESRRMGRGRVFLRSDLERMPTPHPSSLLVFAQNRGGCSPTIMLDGLPVGSARELDGIVVMESLEGVEFYTGPTQIPQQYANRGYCAMALFWTRADDPNARPLSWRRLFVAMGIMLGGYLLMQL